MAKRIDYRKIYLVSAVVAFVSVFIILIILYFFKNYLSWGKPLAFADVIGISIGTFVPLFVFFCILLRTGVKFSDRIGRTMEH